MKHLPFQGSGPAIKELTAGNIQFFGDTELLMKRGDFRPLMVCNKERVASYRGVPIAAEAGIEAPLERAVPLGRLFAPLGLEHVVTATLELTLRQGLILTDGNVAAFFTGHAIALVLALAAVGALCLPIIPTSISSARVHHKKGSIDLTLKRAFLEKPFVTQCTLATYEPHGIGRTDQPDGSWTMEHYARDALGWEDASILGESFGGVTARHVALIAPALPPVCRYGWRTTCPPSPEAAAPAC